MVPFLVGSILVNKMRAPDWFKFMAGELLFLFSEHLLIDKFSFIEFFIDIWGSSCKKILKNIILNNVS